MRTALPTLRSALPVAAAVCLISSAGQARAQHPGLKAPLVYQSIQGKIERVDDRLNGIILVDGNGKRHAWRLNASVIKEAARYKEGDPMWVIYRSIGTGDKAVTAIGFPGSEEKPVYVNATGDSVELRTGPYTEGVCKPLAPEMVGSYVVRTGSEVTDEAPCWCCASRGKECDLANRSHDERGTGRIVLSRCYP